MRIFPAQMISSMPRSFPDPMMPAHESIDRCGFYHRKKTGSQKLFPATQIMMRFADDKKPFRQAKMLTVERL